MAETTLNDTEEVLHRELKYIADIHTKIKTIQIRKGYQPALSPLAKHNIQERNKLQKKLRLSNNLDLLQSSKAWREDCKGGQACPVPQEGGGGQITKEYLEDSQGTSPVAPQIVVLVEI